MNVASRTHIGNVRPTNQDSLLILPGLYGLFGVADGMGGHKGGDVASNMATLMLSRVLDGAKPDEALLRGGIEEVNQMIFQEQLRNPELSGMGTTLTVLWEDTDRLLLGHVGDSRAYVINAKGIRQITRDHSVVQMMVDRGELTPETAKHYPGKNLITRAVGTEMTVLVDIFRQELNRGDFLLLCTDGLSNLLDDQEILFEVVHGVNKERCCQRLLDIAVSRGASDNVTCVLVSL